jgi:hypothetical protein
MQWNDAPWERREAVVVQVSSFTDTLTRVFLQAPVGVREVAF